MGRKCRIPGILVFFYFIALSFARESKCFQDLKYPQNSEIVRNAKSATYADLVAQLKDEKSEFYKKFMVATTIAAHVGDKGPIVDSLKPLHDAAVAHLREQRVDFKEMGEGRILILPSEATELNRSAKIISEKYNTSLIYDPMSAITEGFAGQARPFEGAQNSHIIDIGTSAILNPHRPGIIIAHEVGHIRLVKYEVEGIESPYYGHISIKRGVKGRFPSTDESVYPRFMAISEFFTFYGDFLRYSRGTEKRQPMQGVGETPELKFKQLKDIKDRLHWLAAIAQNKISAGLKPKYSIDPNTSKVHATLELPLDDSGNTFDFDLALVSSKGITDPENISRIHRQLDLLLQDIDKKWDFAQRIHELRKSNIEISSEDPG